MNRLRLRIGGAALCAATVLLTDQQLSAPVIAAGHPYKPYRYVIAKPRLSGITDDALIERQALQTMLQSQGIEADIDIGDRCDSRDCDVVTIEETTDQTFKVNFFPKAAELANKDHLEKETRRQPYDDERLIWKQGSREIAKMIATHQVVHLSLTRRSTP